MTQKNNKTNKRIFHSSVIALLAATLVTVSALAGCSSGSDESKTEEKVITETQVVTREVNGVYVDENGSIVTEPTGSAAATEATKAAETKAASDNKQQSANTQNNNNAGNANNNNSAGSNNAGNSSSGNSNNSSNSAQVDNSTRKTTPSNARTGNTTQKAEPDNSAKDLTIGDKTYNVGDKVVCTYFLAVPNQMLNFQGTVTYDSSMLKKTNAYLIAPASYSSVLNPNLDGRVKFNGSMVSGYDFTEPGYEFLVVEYEVLKTGVTEPAITFEVITDTSDNAYAGSNGALTNGAKIWAVYE